MRFEGVRGYLGNKGERRPDFIEIIGPAVKHIKLDMKCNLFIFQVLPFSLGRGGGMGGMGGIIERKLNTEKWRRVG